MNTVIIEVSSAPAGSTQDDLLAVPFFEGPRGPEPGPGAAEAARVIGADLAGLLARQGFRGRPGDAATFLVPGGGPRRIVAVGAGPAGEASASTVRDAAQRLAALAAGSVRVATTLGLLGPDRAGVGAGGGRGLPAGQLPGAPDGQPAGGGAAAGPAGDADAADRERRRGPHRASRRRR